MSALCRAILAKIVPASMDLWQCPQTIPQWWLIVNNEQVKYCSIQSALKFINIKIHKILYNVASVGDWHVRTQNVILAKAGLLLQAVQWEGKSCPTWLLLELCRQLSKHGVGTASFIFTKSPIAMPRKMN